MRRDSAQPVGGRGSCLPAGRARGGLGLGLVGRRLMHEVNRPGPGRRTAAEATARKPKVGTETGAWRIDGRGATMARPAAGGDEREEPINAGR
jgi:hypothetical protein